MTTAGVGKTALALHWAHRHPGRFRDGQLYINLRGYDPGAPVTPALTLERFLTALGVTPGVVPAELEARADMYRSLLAERRMLVVLDNAATVGQVRPLLPGSGDSLVVVTSRSRLSGLVARDGAHRVVLPLLPESEAVTLHKPRPSVIGMPTRRRRSWSWPGCAAGSRWRCGSLPSAQWLAAALTLRYVDSGRVALAGQVLTCPMLDDRTVHRATVAGARGWTPEDNAFGWRAYLGSEPGSDGVSAYAAPGRREDLSGLPPTWLAVGTADLFHDEIVDYSHRLEAAGVPTRLEIITGAYHGFDIAAPALRQRKRSRRPATPRYASSSPHQPHRLPGQALCSTPDDDGRNALESAASLSDS